MELSQSERIAALIERIGRLIHTDAHAKGLLPVQWETLRYLERANRFSRTPAALTAYLGLTKGTVSQTLNTLEARGLVKKQVDPKDRRGRRLTLTAKGRNLLRRDPLAEIVAAIDDLSRSRRESLSSTLESLLFGRLATRGRQPFGQCMDCRYFARNHTDGQPHYCQLLNAPLAESDSAAICHEQSPAT